MLTSKRFLPIKQLLDIIFPPTCGGCGDRLLEDVGLCPKCWDEINFIEKPYCDRLGMPFTYDPGIDILSAEALLHPPPYDRARFVARYDSTARSLVQKLKFEDQLYLRKLMGKLMLKMGGDVITDSDIILPVPLHRRRTFMRQYNQASLLADEISLKSNLSVEHLALVRHKPTRSQIGLSAKERRRNVSNAFNVAQKYKRNLKGKSVLLIDDVVTTGSTINACATVLKRAGAARVNVLAFARVTDHLQTL